MGEMVESRDLGSRAVGGGGGGGGGGGAEGWGGGYRLEGWGWGEIKGRQWTLEEKQCEYSQSMHVVHI